MYTQTYKKYYHYQNLDYVLKKKDPLLKSL